MTTVVIVEHRPEWRAEFAVLGALLRDRLGEAALRIDHIGSTAISGMAAKDVIDVQVTVDSLGRGRLDDAVSSLGLKWTTHLTDHRPPGCDLPDPEFEKRLAIATDPERPAHVHFRVAGRFNQRYSLLCRDYLRNHPPAAAAHEAFKRELATCCSGNRTAYTRLKAPVFDVLMTGAEAWAAATGWQPGRSDA